MPTRSKARASRITRHPSPTSPSTSPGNACTSSKNISFRWCGPSIDGIGRTVKPARSIGIRNRVSRLCFGASGSVHAANTHQDAISAYDVHTFWPVMRQPSPSATARVRNDTRSVPASGSEKPWHQITSPEAMADRCLAFCSAVPYRISAGPTQLIPMYCGPRGSCWAHISSRSTVCCQTEPPPPPCSFGHASASSPSVASSLQNVSVVARSCGFSVQAPRKSAGMWLATSSRRWPRSCPASSPRS